LKIRHPAISARARRFLLYCTLRQRVGGIAIATYEIAEEANALRHFKGRLGLNASLDMMASAAGRSQS
jgi:hypothetical protein